MKLHELKQRRNKLAVDMRALHSSIAEEQTWSDEETRKWDAMNVDIVALDKTIDREERLLLLDSEELDNIEQIEGRDLGGDDAESRYSEAYDNLLREGVANLSGEQRDMLFTASAEMRANATTPDEKGGYTVPKLLLNRVVDGMKDYQGLANLASQINTDSGAPMSWPTTDGTAEEGELLGEGSTSSEQDINFGTAPLGAFTLSSKMIPITFQLLQDTGIDIQALIAKRAGQRIGRGEAKFLINGTGTGTPVQPKGLLLQAVKKDVAKGTKLGWEALLTLKHSVDPAYRTKAQWLFNDNTLMQLKLQKDSEGRPLWVPDLAGKAPGLIDGDPYQIDQAMPDWADGATPVSFGDHSACRLRRVKNMGLVRFNEKYMDKGIIAFLMFHRFDMVLEDKAALKVLKIAAA